MFVSVANQEIKESWACTASRNVQSLERSKHNLRSLDQVGQAQVDDDQRGGSDCAGRVTRVGV
jgi:hypothetical protein